MIERFLWDIGDTEHVGRNMSQATLSTEPLILRGHREGLELEAAKDECKIGGRVQVARWRDQERSAYLERTAWAILGDSESQEVQVGERREAVKVSCSPLFELASLSNSPLA